MLRFPASALVACLVLFASAIHPIDAAPPTVKEFALEIALVSPGKDPADPANQKLVYVYPEIDPTDPANRKMDDPIKVGRGQVFRLVISAKIQSGYHSYPLTADQDTLWTLTLVPTKGLAPLYPIKEDPLPSRLGKFRGSLVHHDHFAWIQEIAVLHDAAPGPLVLPMQLVGQYCNGDNCTRVAGKPNPKIEVTSDPPVPLPADLEIRKIDPRHPPEPEVSKKKNIFGLIGSTETEYREAMKSLAGQIKIEGPAQATDPAAELWAFILAGIFWGAVSLITPCVFPMIPITVSFFLKQSEKEHHRPVTMALVYSGTIVVVLTLAAAFMLSVFRLLSVDPIMNYALGALFVFFALSLFGMYDIELPSGLARFTSAHEGQGGYVGTMFMALTFTIISFACVAPFLGGFGGTSAGTARPMWHNLLGGLAFSLTFAAPFFFLALFPTLLRKMPKSGSWLNSVKVVMGFLELAAAFKFFRLAELRWTDAEPFLVTFDFGLGVYVALCVLCGLYLLGLFRLPHDSQEEHIGVLRMVAAGLSLAMGLYLAAALLKDAHGDNIRPRGALYSWVESFLLPDGSDSVDDPHTANLPAAVAQSREYLKTKGKPQRIFVDFTGVTCTNCKINEKSVFTKPYIRDLFEPYLVVKIYTDTVPAMYYTPELRETFGTGNKRQVIDAIDVNLLFQKSTFDNNQQLPLYAILEPQLDDTVKVIGVYGEGRINNENAFAKFLRDGAKSTPAKK